MKRYFLIATLMFVLAGCVFQSVFADVERVTYDGDTHKVTITGTAKTKNEQVTLLILKKDCSNTSYMVADTGGKQGLTELSKQAISDENGEWKIEFTTEEQNTNQIFRLREKTNTKVEVLPVYDIVVIDEINHATSSEMGEKLVKYSPYLDYKTTEAYSEIFVTLSDVQKGYVYSNMEAQNFNTTDNIDKAFAEYTAMSIIAKAQGADYLTENNRLSTSAKTLGIDMTDYNALTARQKLKVCTGIVEEFVDNKATLTKDTLSAKISVLIENLSSANDGNNGGGGGSSGGGGGEGNSNSGNKVDFSAPSDTEIFIDNTENITENTGVFKDLGSVEWAREYIEGLAKSGIINGKADSVFAPNDTVTREEFVKMAVKMFDIADNTAECEFTDVDKYEWYYKYVAAATKNNLIKGIGDGRFGVGQAITRQDIATILWNGCKDIIETEAGEAFIDDYKISDYARIPISMLKGAGIINGVGDNEFNPNKNATRAEAAKMIYMTLQAIK